MSEERVTIEHDPEGGHVVRYYQREGGAPNVVRCGSRDVLHRALDMVLNRMGMTAALHDATVKLPEREPPGELGTPTSP